MATRPAPVGPAGTIPAGFGLMISHSVTAAEMKSPAALE